MRELLAGAVVVRAAACEVAGGAAGGRAAHGGLPGAHGLWSHQPVLPARLHELQERDDHHACAARAAGAGLAAMGFFRNERPSSDFVPQP